MYIVRDKFKSQDNIIPNENELYHWWCVAAQDEIGWNELLRRLSVGETVNLHWTSVRPYSPSGSVSTKKEKVCTHPNKYRNVLSRNLIFWVCPDCKKDLGNG
jgi:hypothetical protein